MVTTHESGQRFGEGAFAAAFATGDIKGPFNRECLAGVLWRDGPTETATNQIDQAIVIGAGFPQEPVEVRALGFGFVVVIQAEGEEVFRRCPEVNSPCAS